MRTVGYIPKEKPKGKPAKGKPEAYGEEKKKDE